MIDHLAFTDILSQGLAILINSREGVMRVPMIVFTLSKDLLILSSPFRLIDTINPVLCLDDHGRKGIVRLVQRTITTMNSFTWDTKCLCSTVHLPSFLVRLDGHLDT